MNNELDVYLHQTLVGCLNQDRYGDMVFTYDKNYISKITNPILSQSLPFREAPYSVRECRPFFGGILPEAHLRTTIARQLGISQKNDFALLAAIGGECAGAISILPKDLTLEQLNPDYKIIKGKTLLEILHIMHQRPMIAGEDGIRLSLAGAQDKLPVALIDGNIAIPMGGAPSTHILKPLNRDFPSFIENECFCLQLARKIGLNAVEASLHDAYGTPYLLVKRYDRIETPKGIIRLHQEDFCQALGIPAEMKYQREGGPNITNCFQLISQVSSIPALDIKELLQAILFNIIIGNNDAHGKNFSLLYHNQQTRLAPFYDMISTVYYPNLTTKMAMKIGGKYDFNVLFTRHIIQMAEEANLSKKLIVNEALNLINKIENNIKENDFSTIILQRASKLKKRLVSQD